MPYSKSSFYCASRTTQLPLFQQVRRFLCVLLSLLLALSSLPVISPVEAYADETIPFSISAGETPLIDISLSAEKYTCTWPACEVDMYEVTIPRDTKTLTLQFSEACIAYGYTSSFEYNQSCASSSETGEYANNGKTGELQAVVRSSEVLSLPTYIQVQTPYEGDAWNTEVLYVVKLVTDSTNPEPPSPTPPSDPSVEEQEQIEMLFKNILTSYKGASEEWTAFDLARSNAVSYVDLATLITSASDALQDYGPTDLQRFALALLAAGKVSEATPLIEVVKTNAYCQCNICSLAFSALLFSAASKAGMEGTDSLIDEAIASILAEVNQDGGFGYTKGTSDTDVTAYVLTALSLRKGEDTSVDTAIVNALAYIATQQDTSGAFIGFSGSTTVETTAMVIVALCALGINPADVFSGGSAYLTGDSPTEVDESQARLLATQATPLSGLLGFASSDNSSFMFNGKVNTMATEEGFRALVAYLNFVTAGAAYNIYTDATYLPVVTSPDVPSSDDNQDSSGSSGDTSGAEGANATTTSTNGSTNTSQSASPKTGDTTFAQAQLAGVVAFVACLVLLAALRLHLNRRHS